MRMLPAWCKFQKYVFALEMYLDIIFVKNLNQMQTVLNTVQCYQADTQAAMHPGMCSWVKEHHKLLSVLVGLDS